MLKELQNFIGTVENFDKLKASEKIDFFGYFFILVKKQEFFTSNQIAEAFAVMRILPYSNVPKYLIDNSNKAKRKKQKIKFIRAKEGFHLVSSYETELNSKIRDRGTVNEIPIVKTKPIFISHSSMDKVIVEQFVEEFLERGLGIQVARDVFYTSSHITGLGAGAKWKETIRQELVNSKIVFCFVSENYTHSQYCIAELGAAWAFEKTIIPISITPKANLSGGELYAHLQIIPGNNREAMSRLRDDLVDIHGIGTHNLSTAKWDKALSKYLEAFTMGEPQKTEKK
jgi:hypothetical protein